MSTPDKMDLKSMSISDEQKAKLKELFPEVFAEGKIDFDKLRLTLGDEVDDGVERYGMNWHGKRDCFKVIQQPSAGALKPCTEESINFDSSENLFIEGDNLEVLKLLQKSYYGKVKMIFIDPPYNTGKEFIYPDNYSENLSTYMKYTGQADEDGKKFSTNTEAVGRFHSRWLSMMYPRLFLARNLLKSDGVIFISIDDNEVSNLRKLCDEIFGEENFITNIVWEKRFTRNNDAKLMSSVIDHILLYRKSDELAKLREPRTEKANSIYKNPDNDPRGPWTSVSYVSQRTKEQRPNLSYDIPNPHTGESVSHNVNAWKYSQEVTNKNIEENRLYWGVDGKNQYPRLKRFLSELDDGIVPINLWSYGDTGTIDDGTKIVDNLIGKDIFDYPKPPSLLKRMMGMAVQEDEIVLDFFAGSCTTAHAVIELNEEDGKKRKFIMVQLPEPCDEKSEAFKSGFRTIADIGKERIRKLLAQIQENKEPSNGDLPGMEENDALDQGFKVFKLDRSSFHIWDGTVGEEPTKEDLEKQLELGVDHINPASTPEDILYELLLKSGFELTTKVEAVEMAGKTVYSIEDDALLICLEDNLTKEVITEMARRQPARVVCLDQGFAGNDQLKTNAVQIMKSHEVEDFRTV